MKSVASPKGIVNWKVHEAREFDPCKKTSSDNIFEWDFLFRLLIGRPGSFGSLQVCRLSNLRMKPSFHTSLRPKMTNIYTIVYVM